MDLVDDLEEKPWKIKMKELVSLTDEVEITTKEPNSFEDWRVANVMWLTNPQFFSSSSCPK